MGHQGFGGLNAVLTGVRHWRSERQGFLGWGEFGNQPGRSPALNSSGGTLTASVASSCPVEVGDQVKIAGVTGSPFDGLTVTLVDGQCGARHAHRTLAWLEPGPAASGLARP